MSRPHDQTIEFTTVEWGGSLLEPWLQSAMVELLTLEVKKCSLVGSYTGLVKDEFKKVEEITRLSANSVLFPAIQKRFHQTCV
jgi:hypothetical protein